MKKEQNEEKRAPKERYRNISRQWEKETGGENLIKITIKTAMKCYKKPGRIEKKAKGNRSVETFSTN